MPSDAFLVADEEGFFSLDGIRLSDEEQGRILLEHLYIDKFQVRTKWGDRPVIVEPFNGPIVAAQVERAKSTEWNLILPYGLKKTFRLQELSVDEWDRFHGKTTDGLPFVLSRNAQAEFFRRVDDFDDDSVTVAGERFDLKPLYFETEDVQSAEYWDNRYRESDAPWDLGEVSPPLKELYFKLKWPKSRILILGAGACHDGAFLAGQGHLVTCADVSSEAIEKAQKLYGKIPGLNFLQTDAFSLPAQCRQAFDVIVEHTFFCAIHPKQRSQLVKVWRQCLRPEGHVLGLFFVMPKFDGPPYGASEWEIRHYLYKYFQFMYWQRCRNSIPSRLGKELIIYARSLN